VHIEREALRTHSLPLYGSLLLGDDTSGACSRFRSDLCERLHMARTCPTDTHWWLGNSVDHRTEMGPELERLMSAIGPKQTWAVAPHMSAFGGKADMPFCGAHVGL
jgi:hypothetical protein